ncbi:MAG TPA: HAD-IA family hydrolase [Rhodocyclaceae bacterium]|nr:HAD-IA family hydrolase [Rhodocyclaceae bacterium]
MPEAILFDLDGTLADTAPDLGGAMNHLLQEQGLAPLPIEQLRPHVSAGARGLIAAAMGVTPQHADYVMLQKRFLDIYRDALCVDTCLFEGIGEHLRQLERRRIPWGIVTNKSQRFALPLIEALGLRQRTACVVCGDSAPRPKPHTHPMKLASLLIGVVADRCVYVGDDERDVVAGRQAGMKTIVAAWGYLGENTAPEHWGADEIAQTPGAIV